MSELTERFIDLREDGKTLREIAVITGANYYYVREICRKNKAGIRIQPKKKACTKEMERIPVQPTERTCLYCGKTFFAKGIKKYCSEKCGELFRYKRSYASCKSVVERKCSCCGSVFKTDNKRQKYCSRKCNKRFNSSNNKYNRYCSSDERLKQVTDVDKKVWLMPLIKRDKNMCAICGKPCDLYDYEITDIGTMICGDNYPSIDHILPLSKGGIHTWDNVQLAHRGCNRKKSDYVEV